MNREKCKIVLTNMLKYCEDSRKYTMGKTYEEFIADERSLVFSIFSLSQAGEMVSSLDGFILEKYDDIPWNAIKSIRNRIVHNYDGIKYKIIWNIITNEIPLLIEKLKRIISDENL